MDFESVAREKSGERRKNNQQDRCGRGDHGSRVNAPMFRWLRQVKNPIFNAAG